MSETLFSLVGRSLLGNKKKSELEKELKEAGTSLGAYELVGMIVVLSFLLGLFFTLAFNWHPAFFKPFYSLVSGILPVDPFGAFIILFLLCEIFFFIFVYVVFLSVIGIKKDERNRKAEEAFSDYLMMVASNMRAGMTLDRALWYSARPEFGVLSSEIRSALKPSFSGKPLEDSLDDFANRFSSKLIKRTVSLIKQAVSSGAEVSSLLEEIAEESRQSMILRKEIKASLTTYVGFLLMATLIGAPLLFSVSTKLIHTFEEIFSQIGPVSAPPQQSQTMISIDFSNFSSEPLVGSGEFFIFSIANLIIISIMSSFLIGVINTGSNREGIKYVPFLTLLSVLIYYAILSFIT